MVLVNERAGYRICCECHEVLEGDEGLGVWLEVHGGPQGCDACNERSWFARLTGRRTSRR